MPTLSFEGETHEEIVHQVRRWLASVDASPDHLGPAEVVERASALTKDALSVVAAAAPAPVADSEVVKGLLAMGYEATDQTKHAVLNGLSAVSELSGGKLLRRAEGAGRVVTYQMGKAVARQVLGSGRR